MSELWDAYDNNFNIIKDITLVRGEPLSDGIYHLVCEIIVKHIDGKFLLMQRDYQKSYGGMWEVTAGGSALKGETPLLGAIRELKEETGLVAQNIIEIKRIVDHDQHCLYVVYLCITDCEKDAIVLQEGETIAYKWIDKNSLMEMNKDEIKSGRAMKLINNLNI